MSNKIRLPDHYGQTIGSMNADEITLVHPVAVAADYLTRGIYIDPTYTLDDTPPNTEGVYSLSELQNRIPIMRLYGSSNGYVADLSSAQRARIELKEIEEAYEGSDFVSYPHADVDMHDYNEFRKNWKHFIPLAAVAIMSLEGEVEYLGDNAHQEAAKYLRDIIDKRYADAQLYAQRSDTPLSAEDAELYNHYNTRIREE